MHKLHYIDGSTIQLSLLLRMSKTATSRFELRNSNSLAYILERQAGRSTLPTYPACGTTGDVLYLEVQLLLYMQGNLLC